MAKQVSVTEQELEDAAEHEDVDNNSADLDSESEGSQNYQEDASVEDIAAKEDVETNEIDLDSQTEDVHHEIK